jgi:hypothetical protein
MNIKFDPLKIEPKVLPLVEAINLIKDFKTFSSCEGHYEEADQELTNRNNANIRFILTKNGFLEQAERFLIYLTTQIETYWHPFTFDAYKMYLPEGSGEFQHDFLFVIIIEPLDRFESPALKRKHTDQGIKKVTKVVYDYIKKYKLNE